MLRHDDVWVLLRKDNQIAGPSATPLRANGNGFGGGQYKPVAQGFTPMKQKRAPSMFDAADATADGQKFEGTSKKLCVKEEPRNDNAEMIEVPNVCLNKQAEMSSSSEEDCEVVATGSNSDHGDHHQQQPLQHHDNNEDDSASSESVSSSDGSSSDSDSDSRTRSDNAGDDRAVAAPAPAPASTPPRDDDDYKKADLLQPFPEKDHRDDDTAVSSGSWGRPPLNDDRAVVQDQIHRLELEAYSALTRAFHASGNALSWEKVELLTDLRTHLHISNEEHLRVINTVLNRKGRRFGRPGNF